jgi:hypothetical protein
MTDVNLDKFEDVRQIMEAEAFRNVTAKELMVAATEKASDLFLPLATQSANYVLGPHTWILAAAKFARDYTEAHKLPLPPTIIVLEFALELHKHYIDAV